MPANCFTIVVRKDGTSFVLNLGGNTFVGCQSEIAWQRHGGFIEIMAVCRYAGNGIFAEVNGERTFTPDRGPYLADVWADFLAAAGA
ncbi:MAG TPA: hypothetical protein VLA00_15855 [Xanthobacteraceae bacterium]|nr:hypothetical protein [Xanthobacteraceae bacterium]